MNTRKKLKPCIKCGMDSGKRKMNADGTKFYILCETCGYLVGPYNDQGSASRVWNNGGKNEYEAEKEISNL